MSEQHQKDELVDVVFQTRHGVYQPGEKAGFPRAQAEKLERDKIAVLAKPFVERAAVLKGAPEGAAVTPPDGGGGGEGGEGADRAGVGEAGGGGGEGDPEPNADEVIAASSEGSLGSKKKGRRR